MGEKLAEEYGAGTATLWDIIISAEWILKCVSVPGSEDGSRTGQIVRRAENGKVGDVVDKWFFSCKNVHKAKYFQGNFFVKRR